MMPEFNGLYISVGRKIVVALSGLGLVGFVIFHMLGNLQVFQGPEALNGYSALLRNMPILLWTVRLGLLGLVTLHTGLAVHLAIRNRHARPVAYAVRHYRKASWASRTMTLTGGLLLLFILFHLLHLTAGLIDPSVHDQLDVHGHRDVYGKMVHAFSNPFFVAFYCGAQLVLGLHLSHAVSSSVQTLGFEHAAFSRLFKAAGPAVALVVVLGNLAIVLAIFFGLVHA
jgi:succinate dehydrogenase / fumarate reductase cytochrome b subunit